MLTKEDVRALAEAGAAAPSGGNMQAWRVVASPQTVELFLDDRRSTSFIDVDRMGSMLGLGSFTENLSLAAAALGLEHRIDNLAFEGVDEPLVRVTFSGRGAPSPPPLHAAIFDRETNRQPGDGTTIDATKIAAVEQAFATSGQGFSMRAAGGDAEKREIAAALAGADVVRTFNDAFHQQMLSEMRWTPEEARETRDGVDVATLELGAALTGLKLMRYKLFVALMVSRRRVRTMTESALAASSHLCALRMPASATPQQLLMAGRGLQRMWLTATVEGLALQPWSVIPFFALRAERHPETLNEADRAVIAEIDGRLRSLWDIDEAGRIIFVFRLSHAPPPSTRALRRPWQDFTDVTRLHA